MDVTRVRRQFPVTERMVFLNNAAESPLNVPVRRWLAIVTFTAASQDANLAIHARLSERSIGISLRAGQCRVSPAFYNTDEEIDRLLAALE